MKSPIFVSFHTSDLYRSLAHTKLVPSLRRWGLEYEISSLVDYGAWHQNTRRKAWFLMDMISYHQGRDVVWIDCDCEVRNYPTLIFTAPPSAPLAAHVWRHGCEGKPEIWSSVLLVRPTALPILERWAARNAEDRSESWSDPNLWAVLDPGRDLYELPCEYAWVEYVMRSTYPNARPVIWHDRISRPMWKGPR